MAWLGFLGLGLLRDWTRYPHTPMSQVALDSAQGTHAVRLLPARKEVPLVTLFPVVNLITSPCHDGPGRDSYRPLEMVRGAGAAIPLPLLMRGSFSGMRACAPRSPLLTPW